MASDIIGKKLEHDETVEPRILSLIDHAHSARTQLGDDAVVGDA